jgi:hypothetical protein
MLEHLDETAIRAAFAQPAHDGTFPDAFRDYLQALAQDRPCVILAFPPKAAGTFLRSAAIAATDGQLLRVVHAQGGRDAQLYLPVFLAYCRGALGAAPLVAHVHLQALPANRHFLDALNLKPCMMMRSISDMLASYRDMLDADPVARGEGLNCTIPAEYVDWSAEAKGDFLIDVLGPWYVGYYATWLDYTRRDPARVCVVTYRDFLKRPAEALARLLAHARLETSHAACAHAVAEVWRERGEHRFNRGETGRGLRYFSTDQVARLGRMLSYYPILDPHYDALI